jgi:hypothetical protein
MTDLHIEYKGYVIETFWQYEGAFDPRMDDLDVYVTNPDGIKYVRAFVCLDAVMRDLAMEGVSDIEGGTVVRSIDVIPDQVKRFIDEGTLDTHFEKSDR